MGDTLQLRIKRPLRPVTESEWGWATEAAAIGSMIARSGLQEKTVALECGIDPSTLAKVKQGTARASEEHLDLMMDATGSEAWLHYWLLKRGYAPPASGASRPTSSGRTGNSRNSWPACKTSARSSAARSKT